MTDSENSRDDLPEGDRNAASNAADAPDNARADDKKGGSAEPAAETDVHGEPENPAG